MSIDFYKVPVFVISCKGDNNRRKVTEKRLNNVDIKFQWFDAIDGRKTDEEEFASENIFINDETNVNIRHLGDSGCAMSHKRIWRKIVDENIYRAIVLEDDVVFHEYFEQLIPSYWQHTPKENSMIFLGYCCYWGQMGQQNIVESFPLTTHAYYITKHVAQWFLNNFGKCTEHIDIHMQKLYNTKVRDWKCYLWWEGKYRSPYHEQTKLGVCFNGLILQDHEMQNSINRQIETNNENKPDNEETDNENKTDNENNENNNNNNNNEETNNVNKNREKYKIILLVMVSNKEFKNIQKKYLNCNPNIRAFYIYDKSEIDNESYNEINNESYYDLKFEKNSIVKALEYINQHFQYDYIVITNITTFFNFEALLQLTDNLPNNTCYIVSGNYIDGNSITMTHDLTLKLIYSLDTISSSSRSIEEILGDNKKEVNNMYYEDLITENDKNINNYISFRLNNDNMKFLYEYFYE